MTDPVYYHKTKDEALAAGNPYEAFFEVRAALEPYNGYVLVLTPRSYEVLKFPLYDLLKVAELDLTRFNLVRVRPHARVRGPALDSRPDSGRPPAPAPKPPPPPPPPPSGQPSAPPPPPATRTAT